MKEPWQRLPALSLKQLQYFVTLAQLRHFTDTASRLAISQPALSSALRQIETVLGGKLVNRTAATVTLTELGAAILPHAQRILSVAQAAFSDNILKDHIDHCLADAVETGDQQAIDELNQAIEKFMN